MHNFRKLGIWQKSRALAISSAFELENEIIISNDLEYISEKELKGIISKVQEIQRMIKGFQKQLSD